MASATHGWYCARCGVFSINSLGACVHPVTCIQIIKHDEAERIRARYALGKLHNPDHDTTSYRDGNSD